MVALHRNTCHERTDLPKRRRGGRRETEKAPGYPSNHGLWQKRTFSLQAFFMNSRVVAFGMQPPGNYIAPPQVPCDTQYPNRCIPGKGVFSLTGRKTELRGGL